ncbi:MAG TPA: hypothetical protein VKT29_13225, partial [Terriglobales bacterium]|nr:hypothetical protein [Terriglobales bacterium]
MTISEVVRGPGDNRQPGEPLRRPHGARLNNKHYYRYLRSLTSASYYGRWVRIRLQPESPTSLAVWVLGFALALCC